MIEVTLTYAEIKMAVTVGIEREIYAITHNLRQMAGASAAESWSTNIEGAAGELAFAKATGCYWNGIVGRDAFHSNGTADVANIQVRLCRPLNGHLIIQPNDPPGFYVHVTGHIPYFRIQGWAEWPGCETFKAVLVPGRPACICVRPTAIRPMAELKIERPGYDN